MKVPCQRLISPYYGRYSVYLWCLFLRKLPMCSYYPCLLWILFVSLRSLSVWKCLWVLIIPVYYSRYSVFLPSLFLPNLPNDAFILANAVHICSYWFFKRSFDYARYGMCNLISHYLILSPRRWFCSIMPPQSATQAFWRKRVCRCTNSTDFPLFVSRYTLSPHFPCVACTVNSLSLRTISTYLLKLLRCQSFVLSIIVQNIQLPKYTWFDSTNRWNQFI